MFVQGFDIGIDACGVDSYINAALVGILGIKCGGLADDYEERDSGDDAFHSVSPLVDAARVRSLFDLICPITYANGKTLPL